LAPVTDAEAEGGGTRLVSGAGVAGVLVDAGGDGVEPAPAVLVAVVGAAPCFEELPHPATVNSKAAPSVITAATHRELVEGGIRLLRWRDPAAVASVNLPAHPSRRHR
jgi:hypothetical protein